MASAYTALRAWFTANWTATARRYENERDDPPADLEPFVFFEMFGDFHDLAAIGTGAATVWREEGVAAFHVLTASAVGSQTARGHAETLAGMLGGLTLADGFRIESVSVGATEQLKDSGNYFAVPVLVDWVREN